MRGGTPYNFRIRFSADSLADQLNGQIFQECCTDLGGTASLTTAEIIDEEIRELEDRSESLGDQWRQTKLCAIQTAIKSGCGWLHSQVVLMTLIGNFVVSPPMQVSAERASVGTFPVATAGKSIDEDRGRTRIDLDKP